MVATYVTYVRIFDFLVLIYEQISFADRDYEARTYTYVSCSLPKEGLS